MSIKKTPICPFCAGEMKRLTSELGDNEALIPRRTGYVRGGLELTLPQEGIPTVITSALKLLMWQCPNCNFVAFFGGEIG